MGFDMSVNCHLTGRPSNSQFCRSSPGKRHYKYSPWSANSYLWSNAPRDARFCHRCGRRQFEEDLTRFHEEQVVVPPPQPPQPPAPPIQARIDFGNRRAVLVSIVIAMLTLVLFTMCAA